MWKKVGREIAKGCRSSLGPKSGYVRRAWPAEWRRPLVAESPASGGAGRVAEPSWRWYCAGPAAEGGGGNGRRCWKCGGAAAGDQARLLVCGVCATVQPVDASLDFFGIFGLEREFDVRVNDLERKYKDWQKKLHPDLVQTKSERERCYAADQSSRVITAFSTLRKPLSRALYMLQLEGLQVEEDGTITDPDLLSEVMEIREAVEEAEDSQTLNRIKSTSEEKMEHWSTLFGEAFKGRRFKEAMAAVQRMTYYQRVIEEIIKKL